MTALLRTRCEVHLAQILQVRLNAVPPSRFHTLRVQVKIVYKGCHSAGSTPFKTASLTRCSPGPAEVRLAAAGGGEFFGGKSSTWMISITRRS